VSLNNWLINCFPVVRNLLLREMATTGILPADRAIKIVQQQIFVQFFLQENQTKLKSEFIS
jgi:hypothetical protein